MEEFTVLYGNTERETIKAHDLLSAQKKAHNKAKTKKTIVIYVKPNNIYQHGSNGEGTNNEA